MLGNVTWQKAFAGCQDHRKQLHLAGGHVAQGLHPQPSGQQASQAGADSHGEVTEDCFDTYQR
jgi:hypothetical protein